MESIFFCRQDQLECYIVYLFTVYDTLLQKVHKNPSKEPLLPGVSFCELFEFDFCMCVIFSLTHFQRTLNSTECQ